MSKLHTAFLNLKMAQERLSPPKPEHREYSSSNITSTPSLEDMKIFNRSAFVDILNAASPKVFRRQSGSVNEEKNVVSKTKQKAEQAQRAAERREIVKAEVTSKLEQDHEERLLLIEKRLIRAKEREERAFDTLYNDVKYSGVAFLQKLDRYLENNKVASQQKFHSMSTRQNDAVFARCQNQVEDKLVAMKDGVMTKRRNQRYQNFLDQDRIKDGLYLDIIMTEEYDPFDWHKEIIKYTYLPQLNPVCKDLVKTETEHLMERFPNGPIPTTTKARSKLFPSLGRDDMISTTLWTKMESTPFFDRSEAEQLKRATGFVKIDKRNKVSDSTKIDHYERVSAEQVCAPVIDFSCFRRIVITLFVRPCSVQRWRLLQFVAKGSEHSLRDQVRNKQLARSLKYLNVTFAHWQKFVMLYYVL
jgi:hypothetical protein